MAEVEVVHDGFADAAAKKGACLSPYTYQVYVCESCGCIFLANSEGDQGWYPDRMELVGSDGRGCSTDCECHELPYTMDHDGNALYF